MGTFKFDEADNYGGNGGSSFFTLKNDKDTARVRFLYRGIEDIKGYAVHEVEIDGKRRYVNCLRSYKDPIDKCPFCASQMKVIAKLFLKLYDINAGECKIWERGKSYFQRMSGLTSRYNPLYNEVVEIERNGKAGDKQTDYAFYPIENTAFDIDSAECSEPLGTIILDKTADEMAAYLSSGDFPDDNAARRYASNDELPFREEEEPAVTRRTPRSTRVRAF